ncbi:hypothetical protein QJS66_03015 [Kocuria rhizophila]|nr:hypothetical protein QJS66_03015 [Kocuria rhizophila]
MPGDDACSAGSVAVLAWRPDALDGLLRRASPTRYSAASRRSPGPGLLGEQHRPAGTQRCGRDRGAGTGTVRLPRRRRAVRGGAHRRPRGLRLAPRELASGHHHARGPPHAYAAENNGADGLGAESRELHPPVAGDRGPGGDGVRRCRCPCRPPTTTPPPPGPRRGARGGAVLAGHRGGVQGHGELRRPFHSHASCRSPSRRNPARSTV